MSENTQDFQTRKELFETEVIASSKKNNVGIGATPGIDGEGKIVAKIFLLDTIGEIIKE